MQHQDHTTVFVTGGAGFIGSNFLNTFVPKKTNVKFINIDHLTYAGDLNNITVSGAENYFFHKVDICDLKALRELFTEYKPTGVINFAAESHVDRSIDDSSMFIQTNIIGVHNLLQLAMDFNVQRFHQVSTDEVYGELEVGGIPFTETDKLAPRNPYSASKASADLLVQSFWHTHNLPTVITRSCNVYGPNQDTSKMMPSFITKLKNNEQVPLYGKGEQMREWIYAEDCVKAIDLVFTQGNDGEIYNIGTGSELSNIELTKKILAYLEKKESYISYVADRKGHDFRYALNSSKIQSTLGWKPENSLDEGLKKTIAFYTS